jgi:hypothetical protein
VTDSNRFVLVLTFYAFWAMILIPAKFHIKVHPHLLQECSYFTWSIPGALSYSSILKHSFSEFSFSICARLVNLNFLSSTACLVIRCSFVFMSDCVSVYITIPASVDSTCLPFLYALMLTPSSDYRLIGYYPNYSSSMS